MDFELNEHQEHFRKTIKEWVGCEVPKEWARELDKDEHLFPRALCDKFTESGGGTGVLDELCTAGPPSCSEGVRHARATCGG